MKNLTLLLLFLLLSQQILAQNKIFESDSLLKFSINSNFKDLLKERYEEDFSSSGIITFNPEQSIEIPIKVSVRGNYRRDENNCEFPPLLIRNKTNNESIDRVKKIKLVTHCGNSEENQDYVLKEYLAYKIYQKLTDFSFRVRLCLVTYIDGEKELFTRYAFLIEENKKIAERVQGKKIKNLVYGEEIPDYTNAGLISFFQFMIGNTDWYMPDHNIKVYYRKEYKDTLNIPYDFDLSGFVNKPGAHPRVGIKTESVKERYFLGHCRNDQELNELINIFNDQEQIIKDLILNFEYLDAEIRNECISYISGFYAIINNETRTRNELLSTCDSYF